MGRNQKQIQILGISFSHKVTSSMALFGFWENVKLQDSIIFYLIIFQN